MSKRVLALIVVILGVSSLVLLSTIDSEVPVKKIEKPVVLNAQ
jgi:hypothetical protein